MTAPTGEPGDRTRRWKLIRELAVFTAKASLEAIRDIALIAQNGTGVAMDVSESADADGSARA